MIAMLRYRPHIIHLHTSRGLAWLKDTFYVILAKAFHARIILHMHSGDFYKYYDGYPRIIQVYTRMIIGLADAVISVSAEWQEHLLKIIPIARIITLRNCIDIQTFHPNGACNAGQRVNILFLGRMGPSKGSSDLIEAIHCLEQGKLNLHVWMVGPEERNGDFQDAQQLLEKYHLADTCEILGPVDREQALQLYKEASLFVLPSYFEGLPMVILEALAAGLPIIATSVGGISELVRDAYNGFLFPPGNIEALAGALENLAGDANLRKIMGQNSREIAEQELDVRVYVDKITQLYSSLTQS